MVVGVRIPMAVVLVGPGVHTRDRRKPPVRLVDAAVEHGHVERKVRLVGVVVVGWDPMGYVVHRSDAYISQGSLLHPSPLLLVRRPISPASLNWSSS